MNSFQDLAMMADVEMTDFLPGGPNGSSTQISDGESCAAPVGWNLGNSVAVETPYKGMEFLTQEEAYSYYKLYAQKSGFGVRKASTHKTRKASKEVIGRTFVCNKEGRKRLSDKRECGKTVHRRPDSRVGCNAKMNIWLTPSKTWVVSKFVGEHQNHELSSSDKVSLNGEGIPPTDYIRTTRKNNISSECLSIISSFQDRIETDPDFYFAMEVDDFGKIRSAFWADGISRLAYLSLGDVVVFDVKYKRDHLNLPFVAFTGVNHHRQPILFGCALLADEEEDTFVWLFTKLLKCMHMIAPKSIITDDDAQTGEAIKKVFPNTRHRFCPWHINKHITEQQILLNNQHGDEFSTYFNSWYRASTVSNCEVYWEDLKKKFDIDENEESWLSKMYGLRSYWVDAYLKDAFWAGMTTSQRTESIYAFFDSYIDANTQLADFVCKYDKVVAAHCASESKEDFMTLNTVPTMCISHPIEVQAGKSYTREILKIFQEELIKSYTLFCEDVLKEGSKEIYLVGPFSKERDKMEEVTYDQSEELKVACTCAMFETDGILCRHILRIMYHNQLRSFPDSYILHRWKIDARHKNIGFANAMNLRKSECNADQRGHVRQWARRAKFNVALDMISGSDTLLSKLSLLLDDFSAEVGKEKISKVIRAQDSQIGSQVGSSSPEILREGEEITNHEPDRPVKTTGYIRGASMLKPGLESSQPRKERKQRKCGNCQQLGHYRTSCTLLVS